MNATIPNVRLSKKEARKLVYNKLTDALSEFGQKMKKKRFESNLLKATKLFADDFAKANKKTKTVSVKVKKVKAKKEIAASEDK